MSDGSTPVNVHELSDEDFMNMDTSAIVEAMAEAAPAVEQGNDGAEAEAAVEGQQQEQQTDPEQQEAETDGAEGAEGEEGQGGGDAAGAEGTEGGAAPAKTEEQPVKEGAEAKPAEGGVPPTGSKEEGKEGQVAAAAGAETPEDFFAKVMAPIKADGRTIQLKSSDEVIKLIQMGANYNRKMRDLQGHRKVLTMLENAELLDEGKLDFLIAVGKKDPEAIKKLIKDAGIDPLDIDTTSEPTYVEGSHLVSDEEVGFNTAVQELVASEGGKETLAHIRTHWDQASKDALWSDPSVMQAINQQRSNGLYDLISNEVERLRMLGEIPPETSFIRAYQVVGDHMSKTGGFDSLIQKQQTETQNKQTGQSELVPVATRVAQPKAKVTNDDAAKAAAGTRGTAKPAQVKVNPLSMSDEDFMKSFPN